MVSKGIWQYDKYGMWLWTNANYHKWDMVPAGCEVEQYRARTELVLTEVADIYSVWGDKKQS